MQKPVYRRHKTGTATRSGRKVVAGTKLRRRRVNEPFEMNGEQTRWPEMAQYAHDSQTHELRIFRWAPTNEEIAAVLSNEVEISFEDHGHLCYLKTRLTQASEWQSAPIAYWLLPNRDCSLPGVGSPLHIVLIDGADGTIKALGAAALDTDSETRLLSLLKLQASQKLGHLAMDEQLRTTRLTVESY